jgi:SAM-dependent methyltransferase
MAVKPTSYPDTLDERSEQEWRAYDDYYSTESLEKPYFYHHPARERRFVRALAARFGMSPGSSLIDIGCGNGFYTQIFQSLGLRVTGLDRSEKAIAYCRAKYGEACEWLCEDAFAMSRSEAFDNAFCFWFMYFNAFDKPQEGSEAGTALMRLLKPGGRLFFLWHSDLTAVRLPPERFSVMNFTIPQMTQFFPGYRTEAYAVDSLARICTLLDRYSFNKYVTRLSCARVYMQASSWKRARLIVVVHK